MVTTSSCTRQGPFLLSGDSVTWTGNGETVVVQAWGPDSFRVRAAVGEVCDTRWALLDPAPGARVKIEVRDGTATISNGRAVVRLTADRVFDVAAGFSIFRCRIEVLDEAGVPLLREVTAGGALRREARCWQALDGGSHRLSVSFEGQDGERLYGMGLYQDGLFDLKGATLELAHRNSQASVPFVVSSRGYGLLWHVPAIGKVVFGTNIMEWMAEATAQMDYWITVGGTPAVIAGRYADATGHAPRMPERGLGFWQCKLRYWNQEQLLEVAREHRRRGLPIDMIVADFFHWPKLGDYRFEEEFWPDPAAMVAELAGLGIELMVSVWPQVAPDSDNYDLFRQHNALVRTERGLAPQMGFEGPSMYLDPTSQAGRDLVWELCRKSYFEIGVRTFWLDEAEPEWGHYGFNDYRIAAGPVQQVGNIYPQQFARAFWDGLRDSGQEDVVNLIRCAWAGSQRYGALVWSGDIASTWTDLRHQVVAGIQMGLAGIPWFTTDIGGFHGGSTNDPAFRELLLRWFQFGALCPVMRLHGDRQPAEPVTARDGVRRLPSGAANELWSFGDEVYGVLAAHLELRELLRPYLREVMAEAHRDGQPVMRALFHEFPGDPRCWLIGDSYLLGRDLLVAPVLGPDVRSRVVYLPAGVSWVDAVTGEQYEGGAEVTGAAPLTRIPVFIRGDSAVAAALRQAFTALARTPGDEGSLR